MKQKIVIWGAGGHASVVADVIRMGSSYEVYGFLDDVNPGRAGTSFCESVVLGGREQLTSLRARGVGHLIVAVGDCAARLRLAADATAAGFTLATAIHPAAVVAQDTGIGCGTVLMACAVVNPGARIGDNVIVNTSAIVEHDCTLEDGVHLAPGVKLAGRVRVGRGSLIGIGAAISNEVSVGAGTIVGAGAVVLKDLPEGVTAYGVPARIVGD